MTIKTMIVGPHANYVSLSGPKSRNRLGRPAMKGFSSSKRLKFVEVIQELGEVFLNCFYEDYSSETINLGSMDDLFSPKAVIRYVGEPKGIPNLE